MNLSVYHPYPLNWSHFLPVVSGRLYRQSFIAFSTVGHSSISASVPFCIVGGSSAPTRLAVGSSAIAPPPWLLCRGTNSPKATKINQFEALGCPSRSSSFYFLTLKSFFLFIDVLNIDGYSFILYFFLPFLSWWMPWSRAAGSRSTLPRRPLAFLLLPLRSHIDMKMVVVGWPRSSFSF